MGSAGLLALIGAVCLLEYNSQQIETDAPIIVVDELPGGFNALCVPPFGVFVKRDQEQNESLLEHELVHWQQFQQRGLLSFYSEYLQQWLTCGYDAMELEKEARFNECEFCREHYSYCVRNGIAKTVYNPNFR